MQMLPFWVVKFFLKLHSTASIFGIDKERVELLFCWSACVFQIHTSKQMLPTLQLFYLFFFYFFFLHIIKRKFSIYSRNNLTSSINFFNTTRAQTQTLAHAAQLRHCAGNEPGVHLFSHRGFPITATVTEALGYLSGSSRLISVSTCLLCREFSRLMSTLISQHPLGPADGTRAGSSPRAKAGGKKK